MPSKGVTHPYLARALMTDLDFMEYTRLILKSDQEPSIVALRDAVKHGWHGEIVPEGSPKDESKSNGEVEHAVQSVHGLARTLKDFWNNSLESPWNLEVRCWPGWLSIVPSFSYSSTKVNQMMVTRPACD